MFSPGEVIELFTSKKGNQIEFRFPTMADVEKLRDYINELSLEDTFITLNGEQYSFEEERKVVEEWLKKMEAGDQAVVIAFSDDKLIAITDVSRGTRREKHVGTIGISIHKDFRQEGIGTRLMEVMIECGKKMNLRLLLLHVYEPNEHARYVYKKVGFNEVGRVPEGTLFHGEYIDNIIMTKRLD